MSMDEFDEICKYLEDKDFTLVSRKGGTRQIYINKDKTLNVIVEKDKTQLTAKEEEIIKDRLRKLGYLID